MNGAVGTQLQSTTAAREEENSARANDKAAEKEHLILVLTETAGPLVPVTTDNVKRFQKAAKEGLEMNAKKMKRASCNKIPKPSIRQNVRNKVPYVTRQKKRFKVNNSCGYKYPR
ncbi:hypothetical protein PR048_023406 [Dryococelus australis]|uniref:60S ribosomal protein L29 n=1 Tax=Dryococelus australis TaxID=614101 RepID=A0ABQ9GU25_9NEOP|nr:hypothetical protein PR048_023406 [Dryococelus australis]